MPRIEDAFDSLPSQLLNVTTLLLPAFLAFSFVSPPVFESLHDSVYEEFHEVWDAMIRNETKVRGRKMKNANMTERLAKGA